MGADITIELGKLNGNLRELTMQLDRMNDIQRNMLLELEGIQKQLIIMNKENANGKEN